MAVPAVTETAILYKKRSLFFIFVEREPMQLRNLQVL